MTAKKKNYAFERAAYQAYTAEFIKNGENWAFRQFDNLSTDDKNGWTAVVDLIVGITVDQIDEKSVRSRIKKT